MKKDPRRIHFISVGRVKSPGRNDIADAARTFDGLGEEHEGLARACRRGDGDRLIAQTGGPKLRDALGKDGTVGLGHPQEDAPPSRGNGLLADRRQVVLYEKGNQGFEGDLEFRAAPINTVAVRKRQGINKPTRSGIDAYHTLGPFWRGDGIIWGVPGPAIIAIGGFELRLGENVSGLVAEVNSLAVGIYHW